MKAAVIGLGFGVALGFAGTFGGIGAFFIVLVVGLAGYFVGRWLDGELDWSELPNRVWSRDRADR